MLEDRFELLCNEAGLPKPDMEFRFNSPRRWRFDFAWPEQMIAVEVEGGTRNRGRHTRHDGFKKDCEKYNTAQLMGWRVFRFTSDMVLYGDCTEFIEDYLREMLGVKRETKNN